MKDDQAIVQQLKERFPTWQPSRPCGLHDHQDEQEPCYDYNNEGHLHTLHLCGLGFREVPPQVWLCSNLKNLYLVGNQLASLPEELGQLRELRVLDLSKNQLASLPEELGQLRELRVLDLSKNQLASLPEELGQLRELRVLDLSKNQLASLPEEPGQLRSLQALGLSDNNLTLLPVGLGQLRFLSTLVISHNPLKMPPPGIVEQGSYAVLAYLRSLRQREVERLEARVFLVGEGGVGKSSLVRRLRGQGFKRTLPATHGVDVENLYVPHPTWKGEEITLYTWDFGGQVIYHATHQFFLAESSVYLLLWNARLGDKACKVPFWLETIHTLAPDAKILLVATFCDEWATPDLNLFKYQRDYPQVVGFYPVSNLNGEGVTELQEKLIKVASKTPFVGLRWNPAWLKVEETLLAHPDHHIDATVFLNLCQQENIKEEIQRETLGRYLHLLGKILYFQDDPILRLIVVLKPNWITKAISRVLTDEVTKKAGGILEHKDLVRIWAKDEEGRAYDRTLYPIFVRLMERFDLCYQLESARPGQAVTQSLVPQLLPSQPPTDLSPVPTIAAEGETLLEIRYTLGVVPAGLMSWFLVRTHRYSLRKHWREGAQLGYEKQLAQIELDEYHRQISIQVWGDSPYNFLALLKQTLDNLLALFKGLSVRREIPCRCQIQEKAPHFLVYEHLEKQLSSGHRNIVCPEGQNISLAELLYGLHPSTFPTVETNVRITQQQVMQRQIEVPLEQKTTTDIARSVAQMSQMQEMLLRTLLTMQRQSISNPCPNLFVLERMEHSMVKARDWVSRGYRLQLLCQYPQSPHRVEGEEGYEVRQEKKWWIAVSPWLRRLVKALEIGLPLGKVAVEGFSQLDIQRFEPELEILNDILEDLQVPEAIDSLPHIRLRE